MRQLEICLRLQKCLERAARMTIDSTIQPTLDLIRTIVQVAVVAVGAVWGYYTFVRGRTFKLRLDPAVSGRARNEGTTVYVTVSSKVKNIGLCKVKLSQTGTAVKILSHTLRETGSVEVVTWQHLKTLSVFEKHATLEPGETVNDEVLIAVPAAIGQAFKLELRLVSKRLVSNNIEWNTLSIVDPAQSETESAKGDLIAMTEETTKRIQTDKLERQLKEDKQETQRIEEEKKKQLLKKNE